MWTEERIVSLLQSNPRAVERAMAAIYQLQTRDERRAHSTSKLNGIGFSGAHARRGSFYAEWVMGGRRLSGEHLEKARRMAIKYRRQLCELANKKLKPLSH